jgi:hypothetical protein
MIALLCFFLILFASPFKSKSRLEAENAALDCAAAEGEWSRPAHERGSLVLSHAVSMVSIDPQGHHDHPARDPFALAVPTANPKRLTGRRESADTRSR